jgi:anthranilate 1,2-dioxygenase small subunit
MSGAGDERLLLRARLRSAYEDYIVCLDSLELERWPDFFTEDAVYKITSRENHEAGLEHGDIVCEGIGMIRDRVTAIRETLVYEPRAQRRFVDALRVRSFKRGVLRAEANFVVFESMADREPHLLMLGRSLDTLVEDGDTFRFRERVCVYDNHRIRTSLIFPV